MSAPSPSEFNWPPTDDELVDCFYSGPPIEPLGSHETSAHVPESHATRASEVEESATSDIAVFHHEAAPDGVGKNHWSAEIAHLQALIEALTEKVRVAHPEGHSTLNGGAQSTSRTF